MNDLMRKRIIQSVGEVAINMVFAAALIYWRDPWLALVPLSILGWRLVKERRDHVRDIIEAREFEEITDRVIHNLTEELRQEQDRGQPDN